jgi:transcriptional regulator with XRE-family HTH domain
VDNRNEIRDFLASRRARITPEQAGLPVYGGGHRRVSGLRREEVALLAGVSVDYYTKLERGHLSGVSDSVLDAIANALQLDEAERAHLSNLARANSPAGGPRRRPSSQLVRAPIQHILNAMPGAPAYVRNGRRDILAANPLGCALYSELYADPARPVNVARFVFLNPQARSFFLDWPTAANDMVAALRAEAGSNPYDRELSDLVGELTTRSEEFATRWATQNVRFHRSGLKDIHHPVVGELHLTFEALALPADPGLSLVVYGAERGSSSEDGLRLLSSWAATLDSSNPATVT